MANATVPPPADGSNHLFRDSRLGLLVAGAGTVALDAVLSWALVELANIDTSGWSGWWTTVAAAGLATITGAVTSYKAKRDKARAARRY
jgi:hypothetical protein